jgi:hypothetical protein
MSQIICRICGEPYDVTGGLHYSHSDMPSFQFEQFIRGRGCPCCQGEAEATEEQKSARTWAWCRSVHSASDETEPFPHFAEIIDQPWTTGLWKEDPPSIIELLGHQLWDLDKERLVIEPCEPDDKHGNLSTLWYRMDPEHFSDDERDSIRYSNYLAATAKVSDDMWKYEDHELRFRIATQVADGKAVPTPSMITDIIDMESVLAGYPLLDDDKHSEIEHELAEESYAVVANEIAKQLYIYFKWPVALANQWLSVYKDEVLELTHESAGHGSHEEPVYRLKEPLDDILELATDWVSLPGYEIFQSTIAGNMWMACTTTAPRGRLLSGVLASQHGDAAYADFERNVPAHEFGHAELNRDYHVTVDFQKLPRPVRVAIISALNDGYNEEA